MTLHFEKELVEFSQPVTYTFRMKQNAEESGSKVILDVYLSTTTTRPSLNDNMLHRRLKFGFKNENNLEATGPSLGSIYCF